MMDKKSMGVCMGKMKETQETNILKLVNGKTMGKK